MLDDLIKKYPKIFDDDLFYGLEVNEGWHDLLDKLCGDIQFYCDNNDFLQVRAIQVKEKFGALRFYCTPAPDEVYNMIDEAERKSTTICETCGKSGKRRGKSWLYTACDEHTKESDRE